uniref:NADH-ubiquinone oxidoreductase chain 6 n=1 Tax=Apochrysa matsumurae TaxID=417555 RepID=E6N2N5_APOMA|nr:NADH dehydrogenase subunit 6 [Apochrysa matsumurae]BAJ61144.1 NADH dehydrogenase subunit 6 [Apochrysa matsumurae]
MNQILILLTMIFSFNFTQMKHPLAMGLNLFIQTILISMLCGFMTYSYWFSYVLFLIMLGGMLILFLYVTSLASNELFTFNFFSFLSFSFLFLFMIFLSIFNDQLMWFINNNEMLNFNLISLNYNNELNLIKLYNNPTMNITLMMIIYLFLTLVIVVKMTNINYGPLRQAY